MTQGIDMGRSSWENPEGWTPRERTERAAPPEPVCEAAGPDGWVCDLKPNHRSEEHEADMGEKKIRWPRKMLTPQGTYAPAPEPVIVNEAPRAETTDQPLAIVLKSLLVDIHNVAQVAMEDPRASTWAVALFQIEEMTRDY
jgi:hypothetical protein